MKHFYWVWYAKKYQPYSRTGKHYRKIPVPYTRCSRGGSGWFRYPKTFQELREIDNYYHDEDMKFLKVKHRTGRNNIPTAYDDLWRRDDSIKSWKKHRRAQWKPK